MIQYFEVFRSDSKLNLHYIHPALVIINIYMEQNGRLTYLILYNY